MNEVAFSALGCDVTVACADPEVHQYLVRLFRHLSPPTGHGELLRLTMDDTTTIAALVRRIDEHVIATSDRLLIHGSAATLGTSAVSLVGRSGSGKSTLVAALLRAGFGYVTDEFTSPGWDSNVLEPYRRWLSIDPPSWDRLGPLQPSLPDAIAPLAGGQWQVDPVDVTGIADASSACLRHLFFTTYAPGEPTELTPMSGVEALLALIECTFRFHEHGTRAFDALGRIARQTTAFRLTFADLDDAVHAVERAVKDGAVA